MNNPEKLALKGTHDEKKTKKTNTICVGQQQTQKRKQDMGSPTSNRK